MKITTIGALALLFASHTALAQVELFGKSSLSARGTGGGNGGGSVKCGNIIEMADIHEGRLRHRQIYDAPAKSPAEIIKDALDLYEKHDPIMARLVDREIQYFYKRLSLVKSSTLNYTEDYNYIVVEDDCAYIQLAIWDNLSGNVVVREDLYERMDNLNKAALALHEGIYSARRIAYGEQNSDIARMINAYLLSQSASKEEVLGEKFYEVKAGDLEGIDLEIPEEAETRSDVMQFDVELDKSKYLKLAREEEKKADKIYTEILSRRKKKVAVP